MATHTDPLASFGIPVNPPSAPPLQGADPLASFGTPVNPPAAASTSQLPDDLSETGLQASYPQGDSVDAATFNQQNPIRGTIGQGVSNIGQGLGDSVTDVFNSIKGIPSGIWHALPPVQLADTMKRTLPVINAYEKARSGGASIADSIKSADLQTRQQDNIGAKIKEVSDAFKANPTRETSRAVFDAAALAVSIFAGGEAGVEGAGPGFSVPEVAGDLEGLTATHAYEPATSSIESVSQPGIVKQAWQGGKVAQAPAQSALRSTAQATGEDAGVTTAADSTQGIRTLMDKPIEAIAKTERQSYAALNEASGTDLKSLYDHAEEVQDALDDPTNIANRKSLTEDLQTTQDAISDGEAKATEAGVDPKTLTDAKALTQKRYAIQNVKQKLFNNESVVSGDVAHGAPESINVDSAIRQVQNLNKPSRFAPEGSPTRLQQAFGEKGANNLLKGLYDAQKTGTKALSRQQFATKVLKYVGIPAAGALGGGAVYELMK